MDAMHEADAVTGAVGKPEAQHAAIEFDRLGYVGGEDQDMGEATGMNAAGL